MKRNTLLAVCGALAGAIAGFTLVRILRDKGPKKDALSVRRFGSNGPKVLCLHGLFASGALLSPLARTLAPRFRVTVPDLLGFGASPKPNSSYSLDDHLQWIVPLLDGRRGRSLIVGHSAGCILAAQIALRHPRKVSGLVLFNAPIYESAERRHQILMGLDLLTTVSLRNRFAARVICETVGFFSPVLPRVLRWTRPDVPHDVACDYFRHTWQSYDRTLRNLIYGANLLHDLSLLQVPVLVVQGAEDHVVDDPSRVFWPSNVRLQVLPGVDHLAVPLGHYARAASIISEFAEANTPPRARSVRSPKAASDPAVPAGESPLHPRKRPGRNQGSARIRRSGCGSR